MRALDNHQLAEVSAKKPQASSTPRNVLVICLFELLEVPAGNFSSTVNESRRTLLSSEVKCYSKNGSQDVVAVFCSGHLSLSGKNNSFHIFKYSYGPKAIEALRNARIQ